MRKTNLLFLVLLSFFISVPAFADAFVGSPADFQKAIIENIKNWIVLNLPSMLGWFFYGVFATIGLSLLYKLAVKTKLISKKVGDFIVEKMPVYKESVDLILKFIDEQVDGAMDKAEELKKNNKDHKLTAEQIKQLQEEVINNAIKSAKPFLGKLGEQFIEDSKEELMELFKARIKARVHIFKKNF